MALQEITGFRDLTFSGWHRESLPDDCSWIDIDSCHFCKYCGEPLAMFELVGSFDADCIVDVLRRKTARVVSMISVRLGIPGYKIAYSGNPINLAAVMDLQGGHVQEMSVPELAAFINDLHNCQYCRSHKQGRYKPA